MTQATVAVLLSTYNGEAFLEAQLESLAAQTGVEVQVFARDDGSSDGTLACLARFADLWPALRSPIRGARLGPAASFLDLLRSVPAGFEFYAFCDQDDVWAPEKLDRAVHALRDVSIPALYCSSVLIVDRDLRPVGPHAISGDTRFEHLLFENIAFGATIAMNAAARAALQASPPARGVIMHDWWCALVIAGIGRVIFDARPGLLYRQHQANVIGASRSRLAEALALARRFWRDPRGFYPIHAQAAECLRLFGDRLPAERRRLLEQVVAGRRSFFARARLALFGPMVRARAIDAMIGRILIAAGLY
jgi:glycosyltransferase involved in cell wall biosynthesis